MFLPPSPLALLKDPNFSAWGSKGNNMLSPFVSHKYTSRKTRTVKKCSIMLKKTDYPMLFQRNWFPSISASLAPRHHFPRYVRSPHPATWVCLPPPLSDIPVGRANHSKGSHLHCLILSSLPFICWSVICLFIHLFVSWDPSEICGWRWFVWCKNLCNRVLE